jgi:putative transposase
MGTRKVQLINREIYHIMLRAVEGTNLFRDDKDYLRMIHNLFEFNDVKPASSHLRVKYHRQKFHVTRKDLVTLEKERRRRKLLVEILAFCLMPNHIHLLLRQIRSQGISKFMKKLGGYALYYNKKYERKGHLFQDKFKAIHIKNEEQLKTVFAYIHTNPVGILYPDWKEKGIKNFKRAKGIVENYRWSSYLDYLERKNFPSLTSREFLTKIMGGSEGCEEFVNAWLKFQKNLEKFSYLFIE